MMYTSRYICTILYYFVYEPNHNKMNEFRINVTDNKITLTFLFYKILAPLTSVEYKLTNSAAFTRRDVTKLLLYKKNIGVLNSSGIEPR